MNKYQEAMSRLQQADWKFCEENGLTPTSQEFDTLYELVDRATPKKPIRHKDQSEEDDAKAIKGFCDYGHYECPHCHIEECRNFDEDEFGFGGSYLYPKFCGECGGSLDWSNDE